ncbi:hypothetical protein PAXRUDRAFT_159869 [Paxillus rubicundulus Ve08.2h10]|uniref:CxC2-like cysteine cluster KDZ transposase-associated domain-containing protein n=1 Tax=Paxillus rubicundulus Ve08.2h10 TaxID=930991 RepID=A0A0D0CAV9_9AGAM|nr:hypothetical protein PAXRUDRAFT_159869 [Paxillus rubicundulus Ve08.2h10]
MYCQDCTLAQHRQHPLHQLKEWSGSFFKRCTLKDCRLHIQLGHHIGEKCCRPCPIVREEFIILHSNGLHVVSLDFCGYKTAETPSSQLLRMRFFPASSDKPRTATTFNLLEAFHVLSLESKVSAYEFYNALSCHSDNTGLAPPKVCSMCFFTLR